MTTPAPSPVAAKQWRIVHANERTAGTMFIDAPDEAGARAFFAQIMPHARVISVTLEPVNVCPQYERRGT